MKTDLINIARQQIFEEYITKRQKEFDKWMSEADKAWREDRVKLPYPAFSVYPNDEEIYARIELLHKKITETSEPDKVEEPQVVESKIPILLKKRKDIL